jgi:hypothetical protein
MLNNKQSLAGCMFDHLIIIKELIGVHHVKKELQVI